MAENNSSAPLKTAEGAPVAQWQKRHPDEEGGAWQNTNRGDAMWWRDNSQGWEIRALYEAAPLAVEAQAPAAVAVPPAVPGLSGDAALAHEQCRAVVHLALAVAEVYSSNALIVASDSRLADQIGAASAEVMEYLGDTLNSTDATTEEDEWLEPIFEGAQERWPVAQQPVCDCVHTASFGKVATPALPATEDSSAGDLAGWAIDVSAGREILVYKNCSVIEAEQAHLVLSLIRQAELQAEPVAWLICRSAFRVSPDGQDAEGHEWLEEADEPGMEGSFPVYTAPQAQPADALDAKRWRAAAHDLSLKNLALVSVDDYGACEMLTGDEANEAIDAAMAAAQEGGNAAKEA
jgi:hypothetical protein